MRLLGLHRNRFPRFVTRWGEIEGERKKLHHPSQFLFFWADEDEEKTKGEPPCESECEIMEAYLKQEGFKKKKRRSIGIELLNVRSCYKLVTIL